MIKRLSVLALSCAMIATAMPAVAQDASLPANFGERRLTGGFTPDPVSVDVIGGGSKDAASLGEACVGHISTAPDFKLTYTPRGAPLVFRTRSDEDTTLVILAPDGSWSCNDDDAGDGNAQVVFSTPERGVYTVWVGTYGQNPAPGALILTNTP